MFATLGYCGLRPALTEPGEYGLGVFQLFPLGVESDQLYRQHRRGRIRPPGIPNPPKCVVEVSDRLEIGRILEGGNGHILRMRRQDRSKPGPPGVEIEAWHRRPVLLHRAVNSRQTRPQRLRQPKLSQKLADAAIAGRRGRNRRVRGKVVKLDTGYRPGVADDLHPIGVEKHLGRLHHLGAIAAVMDGVDQRLAERRNRIAHPAPYPAAVPLLSDMPLREPFEISKAVAKLGGERATENEPVLHLAGPIRRKLCDFDAGTGKPLPGIVREEKQSDVAGHLVVVDGSGNPHSTEDGLCVGLVAKLAAHVMKVLSNLGFPQIFNAGPVRHAVVPRHPRGLLDQCLEPAAGLRVHGL